MFTWSLQSNEGHIYTYCSVNIHLIMPTLEEKCQITWELTTK